jgi:hypothetical protein
MEMFNKVSNYSGRIPLNFTNLFGLIETQLVNNKINMRFYGI